MKYFECPNCKGLLSNQEIENEHKSSNPKCKHCGMKFTEGLTFQGVSFKCDKCNIINDEPICPQCGKNCDKKNKEPKVVIKGNIVVEYECPNCKKTTPEKEFFNKCKYCGKIGGEFLKLTFEESPKNTNFLKPDNYQKFILDSIEQNKERIKGGKWKHCGNNFDKVEEFIEHFRNCSNLPNFADRTTFGIHSVNCKKCGFIEYIKSNEIGEIYSNHECKPLKKDKNDNCSICGKEVKEDKIWEEHKNCLEKISQKSSLGIKMEETKNNPKMLMVLGGGIVLVVAGIVGIILATVKLTKIGKNR